MVKAYGNDFKRTLVYDRIKEDLRIFCANNTIDDVYNVKFLDIVEQVKENVKTSISRLGYLLPLHVVACGPCPGLKMLEWWKLTLAHTVGWGHRQTFT